MQQTEYLVIVENYGRGSYGAYVPELPGIGEVGETEDEVRKPGCKCYQVVSGRT